MIRSIAHQHTHEWHRVHTKRYKQTWLVMTAVVIVALSLVVLGYFSEVTWPTLASAVFHTTYRLICAYSIALLLGISLALIIGWSPFSEILFPVFDILQNIPSFALIPLFIYSFGYTDQMIILFAVSSIIWPILFSVLNAIKTAHKDLNDAAIIFGAKGFRRIRYYLAPLSFPAMLTGSIVGIAIGWEAVIGAEIIASTSGFGSFIKGADVTGISQSAIAGMLAILVIVFIINRLVWAPLLSGSSKRYAE